MKFLKALFLIAGGVVLLNGTPVHAKNSLIKLQVTCYCEPGTTYAGSTRTEGIIASKKEWIGCVANVWKVDDEGQVGEFAGTYEILDIGYGAKMDDKFGMKSELSQYIGKSPGTVETGLTLDFRQSTNSDCFKFMWETFTGEGSTGSEVWVQLVRGEG